MKCNMRIINSANFFSHYNSIFQSFLFSFTAKKQAGWKQAWRKHLLKWTLTLTLQVNLFSANLWKKCKTRDALVLPELCTVLITGFSCLNRNLLLSGAYNSKQHNIILLYKMRLINRIIIVMCPLCRGLAQGWHNTSELHSLAVLSREKGILRLP